MDLTLDPDILRQWVGKTEHVTDQIGAGPARRMQATLNHAPSLKNGDALAPFWHYLYFNPEARAADLKEDGHEQLGRFLPPVALPRRMWAGGRVDITRPLRIGERATKRSTIVDVALKNGNSGALCFVTVDHEISVDGAHCLTERQNIVYRQMPELGAPQPKGKPAPEGAAFHDVLHPDPVLLFRYSALIFYGHRIHYDADYARDVEGYPGLLVHGPLTAALLAGLGVAHRPEARLTGFDIRALSPLFCPTPVHFEGQHAGDTTRTWARTPDGTLAMTVDLNFAPVGS
ncbi:MAG: MaoC family dehydratase N-terminal domain-containing protein [Sedimentitalea sp.]